jgi:hypothetical protein
MDGDRILYVCFNPTMLVSRERVLMSRDYDVCTVLGADGLQAVPNLEEFDFVLIGDEGPLPQRRSAVRYLRQQMPPVRVIALCRDREEIPGADYEVSTADPRTWPDEVVICIRQLQRSA